MAIKISDSELEVMRILWREKRPLSFGEIRKELEAKTSWNKSTMQTLVVRLRDKGAITAQNHYVTLYSPNVTEDEHIQAEGRQFIDKLFDGSAKKLVAALYQDGRLSVEDMDDLLAHFKMGETKE